MPSLKNDLGLYYNELEYVGIPQRIKENLKFMTEKFQKNIQQNLPSLKEITVHKLSRVVSKFKENKNYKDYNLKLQKLEQAFVPVYKYVQEAEKWFEGCKGAKSIEKCKSIVLKNYENFRKKGYLNTIENCSSFDKTPYTLSFVEGGATYSINFENKKTDLKLNNFSKNATYNQRCLLLFSYLRQIFSVYLSLINEAYEHKLDLFLKYVKQEFLEDFELKQEKLNKFVVQYEQNIKLIRDIVNRHKQYYDLGENKTTIKNNFKEIDDNLKRIKIDVGKIKQKILDIKFIKVENNHKPEYAALISILKTVNNRLNDMATDIQSGNYENDTEFEKHYNKIILLYNQLGETTENFKKISVNENKQVNEQFEVYRNFIENSMISVESKIDEMNCFSKNFKNSYEKLSKKLKTDATKSTVRSILSILQTLLRLSNSLVIIYDSYEKIVSKAIDGSMIPKTKFRK